MRADDSTAADVFVLELPELRPMVGIDEDLIAPSVRSDRGRLAHLSLRFRSTEAAVGRLEGELALLLSEDDETIARRGELGELLARIDECRSRSDAELLSARLAASARVSGAIAEATALLDSASASLERLVESVEQERADAVAARLVEEPMAVSAPVEIAEPIPVLESGTDAAPVPAPEPEFEPFGTPELLSAAELESFLDRLEARAVTGGMSSAGESS
jgi:hypothetical protein